jgi:hypothetical protein
MELTLNLLWLLLAIPAIWVWRSAPSQRSSSDGQSLRRLLILGCVLMVLFPVVSATDDLQAMRPEMEEAGARDALGNPHHGRLLVSPDCPGDTFALLARRFLLRPEATARALAVQAPVVLWFESVVTTRVGRAPPLSFLG